MNRKKYQRIFKHFYRTMLAGLLIVTSAPSAFAITVSNGGDSGDGSLRKAIADASAGDTITFGNVAAVTLTTAQLTIDKNLTIDGGVSIQRSSDENIPDFRIFHINANITANISNITAGNGKTGDGGNGGGIYADTGVSLTLTNCTVSGNTTGDAGLDSENKSYGAGAGGGIFGNGAAMTLENCTVSGNTTGKGNFDAGTGGGNGGGLYVNGGTVTLEKSTFSGNTTGEGGFDASFGYAGNGGAIYVNTGATAILKNSTLNANKTGTDLGFSGSANAGDGAGVFANSGTLIMRNCTFTDNTTGTGGEKGGEGSKGGEGAGIFMNTGGSAKLKNCTISGNTTGKSGGEGGGIYANGGTLTLENSTVTANPSASGGGMYVLGGATVSLRNSILAGNTASDSGPDCHGTFTSQDYNLVGDTSSCFFTAQANDLKNVSPGLVGLGNNGGPTFTHALQSGSPGIDAGACSDMDGSPFASDQRGYFSADLACDIGAFEFQAEDAKRVFVRYNAAGDNDGTSWADAYTKLQDALARADIEEIWVASGTYSPTTTFQLRTGTEVYGGFSGSENFFSERNLKNNPTTLSNGNPVVTGSGTNSSAVLDGFTVTGGTSSGGMVNDSGSPTVSNCVFVSNSGTNGGGMYNNNSSPKVMNCIFRGNSGTSGGGMYNNASSPSVSNCVFYGNNGGAMYNASGSPGISNCILWANSGGEITNGSGSPSVSHSIVQGDYAGTGNKNEDPLFLNPGGADFHLKPDSPAIDAGAACSGTDPDGVERPQAVHQAGVCDMGVFEYVDQPPVIVGIPDKTVNEEAGDMSINLATVFTDPDDDDTGITKTLISNSNESLLTVSISEDDSNLLILEFHENQNGQADIVIQGRSNLISVDEVFTVTVSSVDDPPLIASAITDINRDEDASDEIIDLGGVFTDIDNNEDLIIKSVHSNSNTALVSATVSNTNTLTLHYHENQNGQATIVIRAESNHKTADDTFSVTINPVDDPPAVKNPINDIVTTKGVQPDSVPLGNVFTDVDNNDSAITKAVVQNSNLRMLTTEIISGRLMLNVKDGQSGVATLRVQGTSAGQVAMTSFTVTVYNLSVSDFDKTNDRPPPLTFGAGDFRDRFTGGTLAQIRITSLPVSGSLKLDSVNIAINQDIPVADISNLSYHPNPGFSGQDSFGWKGSNGVAGESGLLYSAEAALVNIEIDVSDGVASDFDKSVNKALFFFTAPDFRDRFEGDTLAKIAVISLPSHGRLKLDSTEITVNQEIGITDLSRLVYSPDANYVGNDSFDWGGSNGLAYGGNAASVFLSVSILPGDVNYDGITDLKDLILSLETISGISPGQTVFFSADVNADKRIGVEEALYVLGRMAGD